MSTIEELASNLSMLSPSRREFAQSLISQYQRKALSEKQMFWVGKLVAEAKAPPALTAKVGELASILALFAKARSRLKFPSITLSVPAMENLTLRITVAGEQARFPGSLNVTAGKREDGERRAWYGRVLTSGHYEAARDLGDKVGIGSPEAIISRLTAFAANPAKVAAEDGKLNGHCCFCGLKLGARDASKKPSSTALKSLAVGYGKDCAENYGLPWGDS